MFKEYVVVGLEFLISPSQFLQECFILNSFIHKTSFERPHRLSSATGEI